MKKNAFIKGALILIIFNMIGKVIGAVYRLPLAKIIGTVGMGEYQLTFPLYCLILTIATSGMPVAISKLVSSYLARNRFRDSRRLVGVSLFYLSLISLVGALIIVFGAKLIAVLQGNPNAYVCYYAIAPAILFVGVLSVFRGYFQGNLIMFPTAISGVIEQICKLLFGLYLAKRFLVYGVEFAVVGALLGVSISEFFACLFLAICYFVYAKKNTINKQEEFTKFRNMSKELFGLAVPITFGGLVSPLTSMVDSLLVVNLLMFSGFSNTEATMLLGLQSGVVEPLVNIPVIVSVAISTVLLPSLSAHLENNNKDKIKELIEKAYQICLSISLVCFICFIIFGKQILTFLYGNSFDYYELSVSTKLLFLGGVNIIFLSLVQVSSGVLQALGKTKEPIKALLIGCVIKIALDIALILIKPINVFGAILSGGVCYFAVLALDYKKIHQLTHAKILSSYFYISIQASLVCMFAFFSNKLFKYIFSETTAMFLAGILVVAVFVITYYVFFMQKEKETNIMLN